MKHPTNPQHVTVLIEGEIYVLRIDRRADGLQVRVYDDQRRGRPLLGPPQLFPFDKIRWPARAPDAA